MLSSFKRLSAACCVAFMSASGASADIEVRDPTKSEVTQYCNDPDSAKTDGLHLLPFEKPAKDFDLLFCITDLNSSDMPVNVIGTFQCGNLNDFLKEAVKLWGYPHVDRKAITLDQRNKIVKAMLKEVVPAIRQCVFNTALKRPAIKYHI